MNLKEEILGMAGILKEERKVGRDIVVKGPDGITMKGSETLTKNLSLKEFRDCFYTADISPKKTNAKGSFYDFSKWASNNPSVAATEESVAVVSNGKKQVFPMKEIKSIFIAYEGQEDKVAGIAFFLGTGKKIII